MNTRTDIHRPSAIIPSDYAFVAFDYIALNSIGDCKYLNHERATKLAHFAKTGGTYSQHEHAGSCHICGASALYTCTFFHAKSNSYIHTGCDCANKLEMSMGDFNGFKKAIRSALEAIAGKKKAEAILNEAGLSAAWELYSVTVPAMRAANQAQFDIDGVVRNSNLIPYEELTAEDMVSKLVRYGSISDRAQNFMRSLLRKIADRPAILAARAAAYEVAGTVPETTGRVSITGTVLSTKVQEGRYGSQYKMLVQHTDGWKVWSTVPAAFDTVNKGDTVTFVAEIERSKDDPKFSFAFRPAGKSIVRIPTPDTATGMTFAAAAGGGQ